MRTSKADQPIIRADLARSGVDCRRVESEVSRRLTGLHLTPHSDQRTLLRALDGIAKEPPAWCSADAWRYKLSFSRAYVVALGNLDLYTKLGKMAD